MDGLPEGRYFLIPPEADDSGDQICGSNTPNPTPIAVSAATCLIVNLASEWLLVQRL
jgi:hypothetical protein